MLFRSDEEILNSSQSGTLSWVCGELTSRVISMFISAEDSPLRRCETLRIFGASDPRMGGTGSILTPETGAVNSRGETTSSCCGSQTSLAWLANISFRGLRFADTIRTRQLAFAASELRCIVTGAQTSVEGSPSVPIAVCHPYGQHTLCKKGFPIAPEKFRTVDTFNIYHEA